MSRYILLKVSDSNNSNYLLCYRYLVFHYAFDGTNSFRMEQPLVRSIIVFFHVILNLRLG